MTDTSPSTFLDIRSLHLAAARLSRAVAPLRESSGWTEDARRVYDLAGSAVLEALTPAHAAYAAILHPVVGRLVCDVLEVEAMRAQLSLDRSLRLYGCSDWAEEPNGAALALARVILAHDAQPALR